ncbi:MAG: autotransporter outer membrane beta-barrel domain-containing protein [Burkholderiaceae bacterium]
MRLSPVALATVLTCLGSSQASLAANECGAAASGGLIDCNPSTYVPTDGRIVYSGIDGLNLTASGLGLTAPPANNRHGIFISTLGGTTGAASTGAMRIRLESGTIVTGTPTRIGTSPAITEGRYGDGLRSENYGTGDTIVSIGGGDITTYGYNASGAYAWQRQAQASAPVYVEVSMESGSVLTYGAYSHGLHARSESGQGDTVVRLVNGDVHTLGTNAFGLFAHNLDTLSGGEGSAQVHMDGGAVTTEGLRAAGVNANNRLVGQALASVQGGSIRTTGDRAAGVLVVSDQGEARATLTGASVHTSGDLSHGIHVQATGGDATVLSSGSIETLGAGSAGIVAESTGAVSIDQRGSIRSAGSGVVAVAGTGRVTINNSGQIVSLGGHGIDVSGASQGASIVNRGVIRATSTGSHAVLGSAADDQLTQAAGTLEGDVALGGGNDSFIGSGGRLDGSVDMGAGDDEAVLRGSIRLADVPRLDGGSGTDHLTVSGLRLRGYTDGTDTADRGSNLTGWERIDVNGGGILRLTGDLFESGRTAQLNIARGSELDLRGQASGLFTINGSVTNGGTLVLADGATGDRSTITGHYQGDRGSVVALDTVFEGDASATDRLVIQGDVSGHSTLAIQAVGGAGAQTVNGIRIVQVDGRSEPQNFSWDLGTLQVGNYQYVLKQGSPEDRNDWYLVSHLAPAGEDGFTTALPESQALWRPAISTYSVVRSLNTDNAFLQTATLHERQGDAATRGGDGTDAHAWGRYLAHELSARGRDRFSYDNRASGVQLGRDISTRDEGQDGQRRTGWLAHYVDDRAKAWDHLRWQAALEAETGRIHARSLGLGGYHTTRHPDGRYTDWIAHINRLDNRFSDSLGDTARQTGWQLTVAQEVGLPVWQRDAWQLEMQGQWVLVHTRYDAFEDAYSRVPAQSFDALRGRVGLRLRRQPAAPGDTRGPLSRRTQFQATAHLLHDILKTRDMALIGHGATQVDKAGESFDQTYLELGLGTQVPLPADTWLWADVRYELGLRNRKDTGRLSLGLARHF